LLAIEEGRFDDLPGATYAVGFVRTYADYLGLDSEEIVRRFKAEVEGLERHTQLVFPVPKPEGKIPGGAIILISLLLVGVAYGGWYFLSQSDQSIVELFSDEEPAVGNGLASLPQGAPEEESLTSVPEVSDEAAAPALEPEPAPERTQQASGAQSDVETLPPDEPVETEVLPPPSETAQAESEASEAPRAGTEAPEAAAAEPEERDAASALPATEETLASEVPAAGAAIEEDAAASIPAAPRSDQLASAPTGRVFGQEEGEVRIVVRAKQDAWVQVRDSQNQLLLTEVLRSGDVYRVPDLDGLTMLTGNAGGLEIRVDGRVTPTLGPVGVVRRNVALDPQRLSAGTAVGEQRDQE
jgi:cytoskeleton protein RodZ